MQRVCVLGSSGFLGRHLTHRLLCAGYQVQAFDRVIAPNPLVSPALQRHLTSFSGDFFASDDLDRVLEGCEYCFHLVSTSVPKTSNSNPLRDVQQNLEGSLVLLERAVQAGVRKVVYASSGGTVYGVPKAERITEEHPTDPLCSYGITKLAVEKYLGLYQELHGLDYTVLRISNPYGPLQRTDAAQGVIGVFLGKVLRNEPLNVWGDGSVVRDYLHVDDVARAFVCAAETRTEHKIFNIASGHGASLNDIIAHLRVVTGRALDVEYTEGRVFDVPYSVLAIDRAQKELGWSPQITLEDGLRDTWAWLYDSASAEEAFCK